MDIHEYQAKDLLSRYAVAVAPGGVAVTAPEAARVAKRIGGSRWVVKAQIHAGDRAQAGGVRRAGSIADVQSAAADLLGKRLVTAQTGARGLPVRRVYVEEACDIARELYVGMMVERSAGKVTVLASAAGGTAIETAISSQPDTVFKLRLDFARGLDEARAAEVAAALGLEGAERDAAVALLQGMYRAFVALDASLVEINPLVITKGGALLALDAKMSLDDNALSRHDELQALREEATDDPERLERERHGFNYMQLDGDIGCVVTGAGLALATMDIIKLHGGEPANFLDLPPVANRVQIAAATARVLANPSVKALLVNAVGGGITRCDVVAEGVATAAREMEIKVPVIVRFAGTSKEMGLMLLQNTRLPVTAAGDLEDAAKRVVEAARAA